MKRWIGASAGAGALMAGGYALAKGARKIPAPFPEFTGDGGLTEFLDVPSGLPAPVARYIEVTCGDRLPVMSSAVITGRMTMRIKGLSLPGRWRFVHEVGTGYRHYMEVTVFGAHGHHRRGVVRRRPCPPKPARRCGRGRTRSGSRGQPRHVG